MNEGQPPPRTELRGAVARGDGESLVAMLAHVELGRYAQLAGEGLLVALEQKIAGAEVLAQACMDALGERGWKGDQDLAGQLAAALGRRPPLDLRPLPVDLEELSFILEGDGSSGDGCIDLHTGEVWTGSAIEYAEECGEGLPDTEDRERWLFVVCEGSHDGYRDMVDFIATAADEDQADKLSIAISGPGAFRRFRDVLERWPEEQDRFFAFSDERRRSRARAWLMSAGIAAIPTVLAGR